MAFRAQPNEDPDKPEQKAHSENLPPTAVGGHEFNRESWELTDRLLRFPTRMHDRRSLKATTQAHLARKRWLEENGVQTEFLDGGIGCCWFAQQGDHEPVSGLTEDEAILRLAQARGLVWPEQKR